MAEGKWENCQNLPPVHVYTHGGDVLAGIEPRKSSSLKHKQHLIDLSEGNHSNNNFVNGRIPNDKLVHDIDYEFVNGGLLNEDYDSLAGNNKSEFVGHDDFDDSLINLKSGSTDLNEHTLEKRDFYNTEVLQSTDRTRTDKRQSEIDLYKGDKHVASSVLCESKCVKSKANHTSKQDLKTNQPNQVSTIGIDPYVSVRSNNNDSRYRVELNRENDLLLNNQDQDQNDGTSTGNMMDMTEDVHCHFGKKVKKDVVARNQLAAVVILCLTFMTGEAIGGVLSNSLALFTDVLHLGSDLISFLISLLAIYLSQKPPSKTMSFGYHRAEVLGALISVFIIWLVSGVLCYIAIERIIHEHYKDVKADEMLITAGLGVVFNLVMAGVLHSEAFCCSVSSHSKFGHNHSHSAGNSHGHSHNPSEYHQLTMVGNSMEDDEEIIVPKQKNINVRAAFIHVVGDIIQSIGVFVAALIIKFKPEEKYRLADPICTFIFSLLVLITTIAVLRDTLRVMLEGVPRDIGFEYIKDHLKSIEGVKMVHSLHLWSLTLGRNALTVHIAKDKEVSHQHILQVATKMLKSEFDFFHITVQVEDYNYEAMTTCDECLELQ
ncbi:proton-coupled zinc antiporter SLC30A2 [Patella vulgata]|uniref:proton-coupled zinc antiporter SLC30A2 n=1 Tax=Patella vulgata TaxID=6465 RepID=UPI0024A98C75|nr:proton-coupled zinc antiporter SLC30A2 [Patella vulgata]